MILPIVAYGDPVLKKETGDITENYQELPELVESMYETMYNASGVGLAAPQIGLSIRLFVVDGKPFDEEELADFKKVFINAEILEESEEEWSFNEGCLSIPDVRADVIRPHWIKMRYLDEHFVEHIEEFDGYKSRIIQHEYDHVDGILFTDLISSLKKQMLKRKLDNISKGKIEVSYKMRFPKVKTKKHKTR